MKITKKKIGLAVLVLVAIAAAVSFKVLSSQSEGTISYPKDAAAGKEEKPSLIRHDGSKVSFSYPESMRFEKRQEQSAVNESYFLVAPAKDRNSTFTIGVSVYNLPSGRLSEDGSYKIRANDPSVYEKSTGSIDGREVIYFKNQTKPETTAFIQNGSLVLAVGLSGAILNEPAYQVFDRLLESVRWL